LKRKKASRSELVLVARSETKETKPSPPIELVVGRRYLLRVWAGTDREHLRQVLSLLEGQS
jgi:hypothetical protein